MSSLSFRKELVEVQNELFRFALKLTANRDDANDLLQETSLKALYNEEKYVSDTNFRGWMYAIMRNIFVNNYRKVVRAQTYVDRTDNQYYLNQLQEAVYEDAYGLKEMLDIINTLAKEFRIPFFMYVAGFKYREISERLNVPLGTVKSRIFLTRKKLKERFKDFL